MSCSSIGRAAEIKKVYRVHGIYSNKLFLLESADLGSNPDMACMNLINVGQLFSGQLI